MKSSYKLFRSGVQQLGLSVSQADEEKYFAYLGLIQKWNKAFNLTAIDKLNEMIVKHLLDSLSVAPHLKESFYIDVGTGAGLPSIPLAILFPEKQFLLVEPNQKKSNFLDIVRIKLALKNIEVAPLRVQSLALENLADGVISRAFTQTNELYQVCKNLIHGTGKIFAMKGDVKQEELEGLPEHVTVEVNSLVVPFLDAKRHLVVIGEQIREESNISQ